jgi:hypothetical protein
MTISFLLPHEARSITAVRVRKSDFFIVVVD